MHSHELELVAKLTEQDLKFRAKNLRQELVGKTSKQGRNGDITIIGVRDRTLNLPTKPHVPSPPTPLH